MAGLPNGLLSLFGFVPTMLGVVFGAMLGAFMTLPYATSAIVKLRDTFNPPATLRTREKMIAGYQPTGKTYAHAFGVSRSGGVSANVVLKCSYDPGLGFTVLSACSVAANIVKSIDTNDKAKAGFQTAVTSLGG